MPMSDPLRPYQHPSPYLEVYVIGPRIVFTIADLFNFLILTGIQSNHPFYVKMYPYASTCPRQFILNLNTPFGKAIKCSPLLLRIHVAYHFIAQSTIIHKCYQTLPRIRKRLRQISFLPRFHKSSSNLRQNLIRFRLKPRITISLPTIPPPYPHKTYIQLRYTTYPPSIPFTPSKTPVSGFDPQSRYPREGVG